MSRHWSAIHSGAATVQVAYRWEAMARDGYAWWIARLRMTLTLVDRVRLDHFRGFVAYWEVPGDASTASHGTWQRGPGAALFEALDLDPCVPRAR